MTTWTELDDSALEPGQPITSIKGAALRDNPKAIAEGSSGAPKIANAAFANGTLGSEKFQSGTTERDWVLARCAAADSGAVGTYAILTGDSGADFTRGGNYAGSGLTFEGFSVDTTTAAVNMNRGTDTASGTWKAQFTKAVGSGERAAGQFLRIS